MSLSSAMPEIFRRAKGDLKAVATLSEDQRESIYSSEKVRNFHLSAPSRTKNRPNPGIWPLRLESNRHFFLGKRNSRHLSSKSRCNILVQDQTPQQIAPTDKPCPTIFSGGGSCSSRRDRQRGERADKGRNDLGVGAEEPPVEIQNLRTCQIRAHSWRTGAHCGPCATLFPGLAVVSFENWKQQRSGISGICTSQSDSEASSRTKSLLLDAARCLKAKYLHLAALVSSGQIAFDGSCSHG